MLSLRGRWAATVFQTYLAAALAAGAASAQDAPAGAAEHPALPDISGRRVVLTVAVLPPGGVVIQSAAGWLIHGEIDGMPYRFAERNPTTIFVANRKGLTWSLLARETAWRITCFEASGQNLNCAIQSPPRRALYEDGVTTIGEAVCLMFTRPIIMIPAQASVTARDGRTCVPVEQPEAILSAFTGGRTVGEYSGFGYAQASALRDWMIERYKSGALGTQ
jgi:hypothetical protein